MDRQIVYPGSIPLDTDLLSIQRNIMVAIGYLAQATLGTAPAVDGLVCSPTSPASLTVSIGPGSITLANVVDANPFGSLAADSTDPLLKMGVNIGATPFTLTAPTTSGQSINYLIQANLLESDASPVVLPYYNAANPAQPFSGAGNDGDSQNTQRLQRVQLQLKPGAPANAGTQTTPAVDEGWIGLYTLTVNYGQTQIDQASIAGVPGAPVIPFKLGTLTPGFSRLGSFTASTIFVVPNAVQRVKIRLCGGGGGGGGGASNLGGGGGRSRRLQRRHFRRYTRPVDCRDGWWRGRNRNCRRGCRRFWWDLVIRIEHHGYGWCRRSGRCTLCSWRQPGDRQWRRLEPRRRVWSRWQLRHPLFSRQWRRLNLRRRRQSGCERRKPRAERPCTRRRRWRLLRRRRQWRVWRYRHRDSGVLMVNFQKAAFLAFIAVAALVPRCAIAQPVASSYATRDGRAGTVVIACPNMDNSFTAGPCALARTPVVTYVAPAASAIAAANTAVTVFASGSISTGCDVINTGSVVLYLDFIAVSIGGVGNINPIAAGPGISLPLRTVGRGHSCRCPGTAIRRGKLLMRAALVTAGILAASPALAQLSSSTVVGPTISLPAGTGLSDAISVASSPATTFYRDLPGAHPSVIRLGDRVTVGALANAFPLTQSSTNAQQGWPGTLFDLGYLERDANVLVGSSSGGFGVTSVVRASDYKIAGVPGRGLRLRLRCAS